MSKEQYMREALEEARKAAEIGEIPIGAVIVRDGSIIARGHNLTETEKDPTMHAEMVAIREAAKALGGWRLSGCSMFVTCEPCSMCAGALVWSRMEHLYVGTADPKAGACGSVLNVVDEPALAEKERAYEKAHPEDQLSETDSQGNEKLPAPVKKSLGFLLVSVSLWFIAYNAVETWFTTYAARVWNMPLGGAGGASLCLTIATVGAILTYIPTGVLAGKIGRKKTILIGVVLIFTGRAAQNHQGNVGFLRSAADDLFGNGHLFLIPGLRSPALPSIKWMLLHP